ncbi:MAG: hypothetical protein KF791_04000 [Verrucomicrobiae bacterium]|nr:hypothetical protein [Verrucomicrobiae bacterium]
MGDGEPAIRTAGLEIPQLPATGSCQIPGLFVCRLAPARVRVEEAGGLDAGGWQPSRDAVASASEGERGDVPVGTDLAAGVGDGHRNGLGVDIQPDMFELLFCG